MKSFVGKLAVAVGAVLILCVKSADATTSLRYIINGDTSATTMVQGDTMGWECDCGVGDSVLFEHFIDINANHTVDAGDKLLGSWYMVDGDTASEWGPGDSSPIPDGIIFHSGNPEVITPENYCLRATDESASSATDFLEVTPLLSPPATVSGVVSIQGVSAPDSLLYYIMVAGYAKSIPAFVSTLTDSSGNYKINLPWSGYMWEWIGPCDEISGYETPETTLVVTGDVTGIDFVYTKTGIEETAKTDDKFAFLTLTPNPALDNVEIRYMLQREGSVSIKLYDLTGTVIDTLVDGKKKSGYHNVNLDAKHLPSGIYFVRFETNDYKETKKLIQVK